MRRLTKYQKKAQKGARKIRSIMKKNNCNWGEASAMDAKDSLIPVKATDKENTK